MKAENRQGLLSPGKSEDLPQAAYQRELLTEAEFARNDAIQVDAFTWAEYHQQGNAPVLPALL
ncbi:MAG: hypothetical protein SFW36_08430 [Leptolyngbyaceae cyanobacterium bins.59]|nr:hypothetical protein [Leptolyngbyaceae cyanobacterium bins.59]